MFAPAKQRLIGRDAELTRLLSALEAATVGHGGVVLLSGEPGVGKTRLARAVLARASESGARVAAGRCFEQHMAVPFFPFTEAFTRPFEGPSLVSDVESLERWPELTPLLPQDKTEPPARQVHESQLQVFRAVTAFLRALSDGSPLVMLLDDLQWADATSLSLVLHLGRHLEGARVLLLGTYRDMGMDRRHPLTEVASELIRERLADEIVLRRLALAETAELTRTQLGGASVSDELVALVHARADGNAFFTEELVKSLVERGAVEHVEGKWTVRSKTAIEIPRSVRSVVRQRVLRLSPAAQELLQLASVAGQEFEVDLLLAASDQPESVTLGALEAALSAGLLEEPRGSGSERYRFAHALIEQTLYEDVPAHRRRRLHRRVADALDQLSAEHVVHAAERARHLVGAGDLARALDFTIEAGNQASARYAHAEAVGHYRAALDGLAGTGDTARVAEVQYRLARELYDLNRLPESLAAFEGALAGFELVADRLGQARVHRGLGQFHGEGSYDRVTAARHFAEALQLWPADREDAEFAWLLLEASRTRFYNGDCAEAGPLAEQALRIAERLGEPALLARALGRAATNRMVGDPRPSSALNLMDRAERLARSSGDWRALCRIYIGRADPHALAGEWEHALADRRRAVEAAERAGETERSVFARYCVASTCLVLGIWREGRAAARAGLALDPLGLLRGAPGKALLTWMEGRPEEALDLLRAHVLDARRRGDLQGVSLNQALFAELALQFDRTAEAEAPVREAADLLRVGGTWQPMPGVVGGPLAETLVRLRTPDAEELLAAMEHEVATTEQHAARPQVLRAQGLLAQQQGDFDAALELLKASADIARSQRARIQLGCTLDVLITLAEQRSESWLAADAKVELCQLVGSIGPEVGVLAWAKRGATNAASSTPSPAQHPATKEPASILTRREREVALLLARGLTNRQIAQALVIAEGTAGVHVDHILNKLGFRSRAQVAAWAAEQGLLAADTD